MNKNGYDQFFKQAKKNANQQGHPAKTVSIDKLRAAVSKKSNKKNRKFPVFQFVVFGICAIGLFLAIENFDQLESTIEKVEVGLGVAEAQTNAAKPAAPVATIPAVGTSETAAVSGVVKVDGDLDDSDYIYKLAERKKQLDAREEEINKKATEVEKQKLVVEQKLKELEEYRTKISTMLEDRIKTDSTKVDTLVQVYTNMKPAQAAKIFETMDEDLVIEILSRMKKKSAADILNLIKTEKAQIFAERYAGYRLPANQTSAKDKADSANDNGSAEEPKP